MVKKGGAKSDPATVTVTDPLSLLERATLRMQEARTAWIIVAFAAAGAIAVGLFLGNARAAVLSISVGIAIVGVFRMMQVASKKPNWFAAPARVLMWGFAVLFLLFLVLLLTTAFMRWPLAFEDIGTRASASAPNIGPDDLGQKEGVCKATDLALNMEVDGDLIPGQRGGRGSHYASGRLYQFLLANSSDQCTVVIKDIRLEVLAHVVDEHPAMEARTAENHYEVLVSPTDVGHTLSLTPLQGAPRTRWTFNLTPKSAPERFAIEVVPDEFGHAYAIRFLVTWYEASGGTTFTTRSSIYGAFFPEGSAALGGGGDAYGWREEQRTQWTKQLGAKVL